MEKFQVIQPSLLLAPYIRQYWFVTVDDVVQAAQRFIPMGCMMLTFHRGKQVYSSQDKGLLPKSSLSGQMTSYTNLLYSDVLNFITIVFQPAGAKAFFQMPANELNGQNVPIESLDDPSLSALEKRMEDINDNEACVQLIEAYLLKRIYPIAEYNHKRIKAVIGSIHDGQNNISLLAQTACLGYKQFNRIFTEYIGINPKSFLRITRFQRAIRLLQVHPQTTLEELVYLCDYYDISHLVKEFKEFSGYTPGEYVSVCDPYSHYHSLFRSSFINTDINVK